MTCFSLNSQTCMTPRISSSKPCQRWPRPPPALICRGAILSHLEETKGHVKMVEQVFACFNKKATAQTCEATKGLLEEADEIAEEFDGSPAINAALISAAQKVEHYEMASYGCLHEWAGVLGNQEAADLLEEILNEEKAANASLNDLARERSNDEALGESEEGELEAVGAEKSDSDES